MNKTDALFIACCKCGNDSDEKFEALYDKFYLTNLNSYHHINTILTRLVDEYCTVTASEVIEKLNPKNPIFGTEVEHGIKVRNFLVCKLALTETSKFPDYLKDNIEQLWEELEELIK